MLLLVCCWRGGATGSNATFATAAFTSAADDAAIPAALASAIPASSAAIFAAFAAFFSAFLTSVIDTFGVGGGSWTISSDASEERGWASLK
jgi:hypothetical protein